MVRSLNLVKRVRKMREFLAAFSLFFIAFISFVFITKSDLFTIVMFTGFILGFLKALKSF